jgi:hypothetical protein
MMFDIEGSIKDSLANIAKELGMEMRYRSAMPDGQTAHYVQYRHDERSAWTSSGMRDYPTSDGLHEELMSWGRLLRCRGRADRMRLETMGRKFRVELGLDEREAK